ncbi:MAG: carboxypeptidase-like regulatory domain-containing protein, partial [Candidatus Cryptobacteroides sp.]
MKSNSLLKIAAAVLILSASMSATEAAFAQSGSSAPVTVTGKVVDENGEPMAGAYIMVSGTSSGTVADADGAFSISAPSSGTI